MAKRTVRKQRREQAAGPDGGGGTRDGAARRPPETAAPAWRTSAFWLGGLVVGLAVAAVAVAVAVFAGGGDEEPAAPAAATPAAEADTPTAEDLQAEFDERDRRQIEELTNDVRAAAAALQPVMAGLDDALPRGGGRGEPVPDGRVREWLALARETAAPYRESISGSTGHNVARNTIRAALDGLVNALETYRLAGAAGADAGAVRRQAAAQRDNAVRTWSAAGIQLDAINIDAGFGHQHVEQLAGPDAGGQAPDSLPEGTDARPEE